MKPTIYNNNARMRFKCFVQCFRKIKIYKLVHSKKRKEKETKKKKVKPKSIGLKKYRRKSL